MYLFALYHGGHMYFHKTMRSYNLTCIVHAFALTMD